MKRMNLRDVPDDVYEALVEAAQANRQSLSAFVVERLTEVARVAKLDDYIASCQPPTGSGVTFEDAAAAVRQVREAS
jgi:predicted CopG family antitoxin